MAPGKTAFRLGGLLGEPRRQSGTRGGATARSRTPPPAVKKEQGAAPHAAAWKANALAVAAAAAPTPVRAPGPFVRRDLLTPKIEVTPRSIMQREDDFDSEGEGEDSRYAGSEAEEASVDGASRDPAGMVTVGINHLSGSNPQQRQSGTSGASVITTAAVCHCKFCQKSSREVPWYEVLTVDGRNGQHVSEAAGDVCLLHGLGCKAYPLETQQQIQARLAGSHQARIEFDVVSTRMREMQQHGVFAPHGVEQCSDLVGECSLMVAAVPVDRFAAKWMPPDALRPAVSTSVIATPPHRLMTEVVLVYPPAALPSDVFWFEYRLSAVSRLVSRKFLLQPDRQARIGHATDIFDHQITRHEAFQGNALIAGTKFGPSIVSVSTIVERYDNMQEDLRKLQAQREAHTSIGNGPSQGGVLHRTIGGGRRRD